MASTVAGITLTGIHASRPSSGVSVGTLYSCTTHSLIYQTSDTGSTWATWATLGGSTTVATDTIWDAAGDLAVGSGADTAAKLTLGASGKVPQSNGSTLAYVFPPGYEYAYAAITADITTASDTPVDATGLTVTFTGDGTAVMVTFYCAEVQNSTVDKRTTIALYDTTASANVQLAVCNTGTATQGHPVYAQARVTAASGSQSYKVRWNRADAAGTSTIRASSTNPAFIRVTKV